MAARWKSRSDPFGGSTKRSQHPSPAVGSPLGQEFGAGKRLDIRSSPTTWGVAGDPKLELGDGRAVSDLLGANQRAFAARFSGASADPMDMNQTLQQAQTLQQYVASTAPGAVTSTGIPVTYQLNGSTATLTMSSAAGMNGVGVHGVNPVNVSFPAATLQLTSAINAAAVQGVAAGVPNMSSAAAAAAVVAAANAAVQANVASHVASNSAAAAAAAAAASSHGIGGDPGVVPGVTSGMPLGGNAVAGGSRRRSSSKKQQSKSGGGGRWTKEEDQKLRAAVAAVGPQNWKLIASDYLSDQRSDVQCLHRWQKVLQPGLVKGPWTKEEDSIIIDCIEAGITKWSEIAERIPGRIGKQCRERWFNHLDPSLKKGGWTEEEDAVLVEAQAKWGNSWTKIAKLLPGRSENAVKNRWNSATRRRQKAQQRTAEKLAQEAAAKVAEAELADREAEASRLEGATTGQAVVTAARLGLGPSDEDDTECVPKSAIALLRAKREMQANGTYTGDSSPTGSTDETMDTLAVMRERAERQNRSSPESLKVNKQKFDSLGALAPSTRSRGLGTGSGGSGPGPVKAEDMDTDTLPEACPPGLHTEETSSPLEQLFGDSSLTEREKELIQRAYLAGVQQSSTGDSMKLKLKRDGSGGVYKNDVSSPVQWDFAQESATTNTTSNHAPGAAIPVDFLREHGIEFDLTEADQSQEQINQLAQLVRGDPPVKPELEDDLELSSSLLTMSLDKDIPIDEMSLSAGEKQLLGRPIASDAMSAIVSGSDLETGGSKTDVSALSAGGPLDPSSPTANILSLMVEDPKSSLPPPPAAQAGLDWSSSSETQLSPNSLRSLLGTT